MEFMFWGSFSYNKKGPCHIWRREMAKKRVAAEKELEQLNVLQESECRAAWELETSIKK